MPQTQQSPQVKLRLPASLKDEIAKDAKANQRSMNAEIVYRLQCAGSKKGRNAQS